MVAEANIVWITMIEATPQTLVLLAQKLIKQARQHAMRERLDVVVAGSFDAEQLQE